MSVLKKILVVDDDPVIVNLLKLRLSTVGYDVYTAEDGEEGLRSAIALQPDLIILDLVMPKMDGSTVAAKLKEDASLSDVPVIFLTCIVSEAETQESEHHIAGHMFFAKPFDSAELIETVARLIA